MNDLYRSTFPYHIRLFFKLLQGQIILPLKFMLIFDAPKISMDFQLQIYFIHFVYIISIHFDNMFSHKQTVNLCSVLTNIV